MTDDVARKMDLSDLGNGDLYAAHTRDELVWCDERATWYAYDRASGTWAVDHTLRRHRAAAEVADLLLDLAAAQPDENPIQPDGSRAAGKTPRKRAWAWAVRSRDSARQSAMISMSRSVPGMHVAADAFDRHPLSLVAAGGQIVDLRDGSVRPCEPSDLATRSCRARYLPLATAPRWQRFLREIAPVDDADAWIEYLRRAVGMSLVGERRDARLFFLAGRGSNGKSTFHESVAYVLGSYHRQLMPDAIMESLGERHPTEIADLEGARMVVAEETRSGGKLDAGKVKRLTGSETIKARGMREDPREFPAQFTLWIDGNSSPKIRGTDEGIWGRMVRIPFQAHFPRGGPTEDRGLKHTLRGEGDGILAWAVTGAIDYLRDGLPACASIAASTAEYRQDEDLLGSVLEQIVEPVELSTIPTQTLYDRVSAVYREDGLAPPCKNTLGKMLRERGWSQFGSRRDGRVWSGWRLLDPPSDRWSNDYHTTH